MIDDIELRRHVLDELNWDSSLDATHVGVTAVEGVVTLTGHVRSYPAMFAARRAASRVVGVRVVADKLAVRLPDEHCRDDSDIAISIAHVLESNVHYPESALKADVRKGIVTLRGKVDWQNQRHHLEKQVAHVSGVRDVLNYVELREQHCPDDVEQQIRDALSRNAVIDARFVRIGIEGNTVHLDGNVGALHESEAIERAAWSARGILDVTNAIRIG